MLGHLPFQGVTMKGSWEVLLLRSRHAHTETAPPLPTTPLRMLCMCAHMYILPLEGSLAYL